MYVLGIETSCDETSASIVKDGRAVFSNVVASSLRFHKKYGGVVPEIASRMQLETITAVCQSALEEAHLSLKEVGLICVTGGPGLLGSLLVGVSFAKAASFSLGIPLLGVNHIYSHIYANFLNSEGIKLPFVALVVSGGHTALFYVRDFTRIEALGNTQDDACGEAFDKVGKILGMGYPGGPLIEKLAKKGDARKIKFNCSGTQGALDFSFSGIKTAVLYYVQGHGLCVLRHGSRPKTHDPRPTTHIADIAASFQEAVIDTLIRKSFSACGIKGNNRLVIGGGVAANQRLKDKFNSAAKPAGIKCYFPPPGLCMDNAAMVAGFGFQLYRRGRRSGLGLNVELS
ncbi:MAG: tRNA (adenosine(37)-N6)-threonylcarbamoyltransferase complex transferase subunit TsaD [Candidatus Omnitrophota bacterium]|nr:tRNA (adenosine(37)-N6)-threonylcarbamoyltransferase complex transferase subunit TsaD [Candidatus Omnitrophota bacterium]